MTAHESDHARFGNATMNAGGDVTPWIIGIPLDGTRGTRAIRDTDGGHWDRDPVWDRAVGPMQFIPSTWRAYGVDATGSGVADPHNFIDAVHSAARYLCANGAGKPDRLRQAVFRYNNSWAYVDQVLTIAERYSTASLQHGSVGDYALPVDRDRLNIELISRPHHTYPAWDLALPVGTQVYAVHGGTVIATPAANSRCGLGVVVAGRDGARYTYCHASALQVTRGQDIQPGQPIMRSGNTGRSSGPHLHLDIRWDGQLVCPQPLLEAWFEGRHVTLAQTPRGGCFY